MSDRFQMIMAGVNVTTALDKKSFPKWLKESFKGAGVLDFQVSPFRFKIIRFMAEDLIGSSLAREMTVKLVRPGTGEVLLNGFIDSIGEKSSKMPQLTVYPNALLLKDTRPGEQKNLNDSDWQPGDPEDESVELVRDFNSDGTEHIRTIVQKMLLSINEQKGTSFVADSTSIPDSTGNGQQKFFGNILDSVDQSAWWVKLLGPLALLVAWLTEDDYQIRLKNGIYYLVKRDFGIFQKLWIVAGGLLNVSPSLSISKGWFFSSSRLGIYVPSSSITLFNWGRWTIPEDDWTLPNIGIQISVYRMASGGLDHVDDDSISVFPQPDIHPTSGEMNSLYGSVVHPNYSANIPEAKIRAFLEEEGYQGDTAEIISKLDLDTKNTYVIVKAQKQKNDLTGSTLLLSFETTFDDSYEIHYRDTKASGIMRDLCTVSNRIWYVDTQDKVYMVPRSLTGSEFAIAMEDVISFKDSDVKATTRPVQLNRYEEDDGGKVTSRGIKLRQNEYDAIISTVEGLMEEGLTRAEVELIHRPGYGILKNATLDGVSLGQVVERSQHLFKPLEKMKLEEAL